MNRRETFAQPQWHLGEAIMPPRCIAASGQRRRIRFCKEERNTGHSCKVLGLYLERPSRKQSAVA